MVIVTQPVHCVGEACARVVCFVNDAIVQCCQYFGWPLCSLPRPPRQCSRTDEQLWDLLCRGQLVLWEVLRVGPAFHRRLTSCGAPRRRPHSTCGHVQANKFEVCRQFSGVPQAIFVHREENVRVLEVFTPRLALGVPDHVLDAADHHEHELCVERGSTEDAAHCLPELGETERPRSVFVCEDVKSGSKDVPAIGPEPSRQGDLLPHEDPGHKRVERQLGKELSWGCKETGCYVSGWHDGWLPSGALAAHGVGGAYADDMGFYRRLGKCRCAEQGRAGPFPVSVLARRVRGYDGFGAGSVAHHVHQFFIPMLDKPNVRVDLHEELFAAPQFGCEVACRCWAERLCLPHRKQSDLPRFAPLCELRVCAKVPYAMAIWRGRPHLRFRRLHSRTGHNQDSCAAVLKAVLHHNSHMKLVRIRCVAECLDEGVLQSMVAVGCDGHEDRPVFADWEHGSPLPSSVEGQEGFLGCRAVGLVHLELAPVVELKEALVKPANESIQVGYDAGHAWGVRHLGQHAGGSLVFVVHADRVNAAGKLL
mmetsp:Transcript_32863/g.95058  ORF Transcript_32863/g.95058 Transcript_32863/m.95058 type:complete len:535 (-) Transcript_32863:476-2080(-)